MKYSIQELDNMEGHEFEYAVADLLRHNGWRDVEVTQGSGDYGIDILARRGNTRYAIQCKRYNSAVGVKAVQEAGLGVDYYHYDAAAVITNNVFTKQAENIARTTGVRLWGRDFLEELIENYDEGYDEFYNRQFFADTNIPNAGISKVCPSCGREFLSSSFKCPVCQCNLIHLSAQAQNNIKPQKPASPQRKRQALPQKQMQKSTAIKTASKKEDDSKSNKPSGLSIAALALSFLGQLSAIGIILAIIDLCKKDGRRKTYSVIALITGCIMVSLVSSISSHFNENTADNQAMTNAESYSHESLNIHTESNAENILSENITNSSELTKEELLLAVLENNTEIKDRLLDFKYIPESNLTKFVIRSSGGFSNKMMITSARIDIMEILKAVQPVIDTNVSISVNVSGWDTYGNPVTTDIIVAEFSLNTIQKINFENFLHENIPTIADYWWIHSSINPEK